MNSTRRLSQSVFNDLQLADVGIDLTSVSDMSEKHDKVHRREGIPWLESQLDASAENCNEILILASYMIRTWQNRQVTVANIADPHKCTSVQERGCAVGNDSALRLPPPVKYNRDVRKSKTVSSGSS